MNTALNRTGVFRATNKSGGAVAQGDLVILGSATAKAFTTTTTLGYKNSIICVVLEPDGIPNDEAGMIAMGIWVPKLKLGSAAALYDFIKHDSVAKQGTPHAAPMVAGDFAIALQASATPEAILFGAPIQIGSTEAYTDEQAQDAIGAMVADTDTLDITYTDATPELKGDVKKQMSITSDASGLKLSGDATSPGNNKVYGTDGSGVKGWKNDPTGGGGALVQRVGNVVSTSTTGTTVLPYDDSIPQNTEGDEYLTQAITPTDAGNDLYIHITIFGSIDSADYISVALFQDGNADALAADGVYIDSASASATIHFIFKMAAGTTSSTTFKVKAGKSTSGTFRLNGRTSTGRIFGGVACSSIVIDEIAP